MKARKPRCARVTGRGMGSSLSFQRRLLLDVVSAFSRPAKCLRNAKK